jgi:uncharacterized membrane protein (DUF106 family)
MSIPSPWNLLILSTVISVALTLAYKYFTNQKMMKELKDDMKSMQAEMKSHKDNPDKMMELQKKVLEKNMKYMLESLKPTIITFIPILFILNWLREYYNALGSPDILFGIGWIWIYIIFSVILSIALRKLFKVY